VSTDLLTILPFVAVLSALLVITVRNPIIAVLFLIAVFISASGYLALLGLTFLALSYIVIYVGAIAILFLFVVMMLDIKLEEVAEVQSPHYPIAATVGVSFTWFLINPLYAIDSNKYWSLFDSLNLLSIDDGRIGYVNPATSTWSTGFHPFEQLQSIGVYLFTASPILLIIASMILMLAMAGPICLALMPSSYTSNSSNSPSVA